MADIDKLVAASEVYAYMLQWNRELEVAYKEKMVPEDIVTCEEVAEIIAVNQ